MTTNIVQFPSEKALRDNLPVNDCLNQAKVLNLDSCVVLGFMPGENGRFFFSASKDVTNESTLFLLKCAEKHLFDELD